LGIRLAEGRAQVSWSWLSCESASRMITTL
jgi:hypothetical protein